MGRFCIGDVVIVDRPADFKRHGYVGVITKMSSEGNFVRLENCCHTEHKQCLANVSWIKPFHADDSFDVQDLSILY